MNKVKKRKPVRKHKLWFDQDSDTLYRNLKSTTKNCNDANKLMNYYKLRKNYKRLIHKKQRNYKSKQLTSLEDLESKDSKTFWNVINRFKNGDYGQNDPSLNEPRSEKTGLRGFRPGPTQTGL